MLIIRNRKGDTQRLPLEMRRKKQKLKVFLKVLVIFGISISLRVETSDKITSLNTFKKNWNMFYISFEDSDVWGLNLGGPGFWGPRFLSSTRREQDRKLR